MRAIINDYKKLDSIISNSFNSNKHKEQLEKLLTLFFKKHTSYNKNSFNVIENNELSIELTMLLKEKLNKIVK